MASLSTIDFHVALNRGMLSKARNYVEIEPDLYMVRTDRSTFYIRASRWDMADAAERMGIREARR
jgi:hypothetical protein